MLTTPAAPINPRVAPTSTVSSSATVISVRVPATGDGISVSTLSVLTSSSGSSTATSSPTALSQRVTVPSVTLSPRAGKVTAVASVGAAEAADGAATGATASVVGAASVSGATAGVGTAATGSAGGGATGEALASAGSPTIASSPPTSTTSSSTALISSRIPATGDGISVSTLSVLTSRSGSSMATSSPMFFSQRVTVPSVTLSPSCGIVMETGIWTAPVICSVVGPKSCNSVRRVLGNHATREHAVVFPPTLGGPRRALRSVWGARGLGRRRHRLRPANSRSAGLRRSARRPVGRPCERRRQVRP